MYYIEEVSAIFPKEGEGKAILRNHLLGYNYFLSLLVSTSMGGGLRTKVITVRPTYTATLSLVIGKGLVSLIRVPNFELLSKITNFRLTYFI